MLKIIGCGGHARSVADIYSSSTDDNIIFYDDNARDEEYILNYPVRKIKKLKITTGDKLHIAIGDNEKREKFFSYYSQDKRISFPNVISNNSYISKTAKLKEGILIGDFCHIGPEVEIGSNTIINNGAIVEHEVKIGDNCHIAPRAVISGRSKIGNNVFLGVGAIVKDSVIICDNIILGAGAVIVNNLLEAGTYVGIPARKIK